MPASAADADDPLHLPAFRFPLPATYSFVSPQEKVIGTRQMTDAEPTCVCFNFVGRKPTDDSSAANAFQRRDTRRLATHRITELHGRRMRFFSALIANVLQGKIIVQTKKSYGHSRPTACFVALILGLLCFMTESAQEEPEPVMKFKVTYSIPSVTKSGVCFGFESVSTYPKEVVATFVYLEKESQIVYPGGDAEPLRVIKREDLVAASVKYGDGTWDLPLLEKFELNITADSNPESVTATKLSYNFFPILTRTTKDGIVLNNDF